MGSVSLSIGVTVSGEAEPTTPDIQAGAPLCGPASWSSSISPSTRQSASSRLSLHGSSSWAASLSLSFPHL